MRTEWIGAICAACFFLSGDAWAQTAGATRAPADGAVSAPTGDTVSAQTAGAPPAPMADDDPPALRVDIGVRAGGIGGLGDLGSTAVLGFIEEPHWLDGELDSGGSVGVTVDVEPRTFPLAFRVGVDYTLGAVVRIRTRGCGAGPETVCGYEPYGVGMLLAFGDLVWRAGSSGTRWRPFAALGGGVVRMTAREPFACIPESGLCNTRLLFLRTRTEPGAHGAIGVEHRLDDRIRLSVEGGVYASRFELVEGGDERDWNTIAALSLGARLRVR